MSFCALLIEVGEALHDLARDLAQWSRATFGSDQDRGPIGPLKHLEKEAREAQANPLDIMEYADCLLLVLDASRRAGHKPLELLRAAQKKMEINKARTWPKAASDEPVEHCRTGEAP